LLIYAYWFRVTINRQTGGVQITKAVQYHGLDLPSFRTDSRREL